MPLAEVVGDRCPNVDFEDLQGLGNEVAQGEVEFVGGPDVLEGRAVVETGGGSSRRRDSNR